LNEILHGGRPKGEEPHVKKSVKKKEERTEYILRVDLVKIKPYNKNINKNKKFYSASRMS